MISYTLSKEKLKHQYSSEKMEFNNILDFINKDEFRNWKIIEDY